MTGEEQKLEITQEQARLALEWNEVSMERMGFDESRLIPADGGSILLRSSSHGHRDRCAETGRITGPIPRSTPRSALDANEIPAR